MPSDTAVLSDEDVGLIKSDKSAPSDLSDADVGLTSAPAAPTVPPFAGLNPKPVNLPIPERGLIPAVYDEAGKLFSGATRTVANLPVNAINALARATGHPSLAVTPFAPETPAGPLKPIAQTLGKTAEVASRGTTLGGVPQPSSDFSRGTGQAVEQTAEGLLTPESIASLPFLEFKAGRLLMFGQMLAGTPEQMRRTYQTVTDPDATNEQKWAALGQAGINLAMTGSLGLHLGVEELRSRYSPQQVSEQLKEKGTSNAPAQPPNAQQVQEPPPGGLPAQPGQPPVRPAEEQAQAGTPQRRGQGEEKQKEPVLAEIQKVQSMSPAEQTAYFRANQSRADNAAYRLGRSTSTPEGVAALEAASEAAMAKSKAAFQAQDLSAAIEWQTISQNFREAHEAATGTGSAGKFLRDSDPNYKPPVPLAEDQSITNKREAAKSAPASKEAQAAAAGPQTEQKSTPGRQHATDFPRAKAKEREMDFFRSLGLNERDAETLWRRHHNPEYPAEQVITKLSPQALAKWEAFSQEEPGYQFEEKYNPEKIEAIDSPKSLANELVGAPHPDADTPGDILEFKLAALKKLRDNGGTWSDIARALDDLTTARSGSQSDKQFLFRDLGAKIRQFAARHGIDLPQGELGARIPASVPEEAAGQFGPGAAQAAGSTVPPAGAVGSVYSNILPLDELASSVRRFPRQPGTFADKIRQWLDQVGVPVKDKFIRTWAALRAVPAWIKTQATTLPEVTNLDRRVGIWNGEDWSGSQAARKFSSAVKAQFPDRSKLRALSNWINADGDKALLARWAALTSDPALRKTYEDAIAFGPQEERLAADIRQYHDEMLAWAQREGALVDGLENYLHRYYRPDDPALQRKLANVEYLRFSKDFNGFKKRYYDSDFEAEQAGLKPEKDAAKRILAYDYGFRQALTARGFVRKSFDANAVAKDGRPELDVVGGGWKIEEPGQKPVTLIKPKWRQDTGDPMDYRGDYVRFEHPAFKKWHFASTDSAGNPILVDGEVLVHPDFAKRYAALFEKSWWGKTPFRRALLNVSNFTKQTMLQGPFHLVQITTGGIEHRINPFKLVELEPHHPDQIRMAEAGLFAGDQGARYMTEGVAGGGLLEKLPIAGEYMQTAKDWLFNDYIQRWKMTLALEAEKRNMVRYRDDLRQGKITPEQITRMSARQAAAVFGGQNMRAIYRSKTFQDTLRFMFLAPDFGEERLRQVFQAGGKYGHEQRIALVAGAMGLMVLAKLTEKALTGRMDFSPKHIFSVTYNGKEYSLRNPASDIAHFITDPIGYLRNRLNPVYTRPLLELVTGRDQFGRKRNYGQQLKDQVKQIVPIPARGLVEKEQTVLESFLNSTGLTEHRRSDFTDMMKTVNQWKAAHNFTEPGEFVYDPDKDPYHPLTSALSIGSKSAIQSQLRAALANKGPAEKVKLFQHYARSLAPNRPFTGSALHEHQFLASLSPAQKQDYSRARAERLMMWRKFLDAWRLANTVSAPPQTQQP